MTTMTEAEAAELAIWHIGKLTVPEWLASGPSPDRKRAVLVRLLDRVHTPNGLLIKVLARDLGMDPDALWAERHPRKAAKYAAACRARGDHPHADKLHAALISLMFCANCGVPLVDPLSIDRGIGPDCWERIDPAWRQAIITRIEAA